MVDSPQYICGLAKVTEHTRIATPGTRHKLRSTSTGKKLRVQDKHMISVGWLPVPTCANLPTHATGVEFASVEQLTDRDSYPLPSRLEISAAYSAKRMAPRLQLHRVFAYWGAFETGDDSLFWHSSPKPYVIREDWLHIIIWFLVSGRIGDINPEPDCRGGAPGLCS